MAASPCRGSSPNVNGSTMITVMVLVMPGSAPPTTPTSVPRTSGSRYLSWAKLPTADSSRSGIGSPARQPAARQQHVQVELEHDIAQRGGERRHDHHDEPAAQAARRLQQ